MTGCPHHHDRDECYVCHVAAELTRLRADLEGARGALRRIREALKDTESHELFRQRVLRILDEYIERWHDDDLLDVLGEVRSELREAGVEVNADRFLERTKED